MGILKIITEIFIFSYLAKGPVKRNLYPQPLKIPCPLSEWTVDRVSSVAVKF